MKKMWLKSDPVVTAEIVRELNGAVVAQVSNPRLERTEHPVDYLGFIDLDQWSSVEVVPVPICTAPKLWIAVVGEVDPVDVTYVSFDNEVALRVAIATRTDILGHFEVTTPPSMFPAKMDS